MAAAKTEELLDQITMIEFRMHLRSGGRTDVKFLRREKLRDLIEDNGSLGEFLRDLAEHAFTMRDIKRQGSSH